MDNLKICSNCGHCEPDDICHESLDVIYWCSVKCYNVFGSDVCCSHFVDSPIPL